MTDDKILALIFACEEGDGVDYWYEHYLKVVPMWANEEHSGDCKKQPWTCVRCLYESKINVIDEHRRLLEMFFEK